MVVDENAIQGFALGIWVSRFPFTELTMKTKE